MTNKSTAAFSSHMVGRHIVRPNGERAYIVAALSTGRRVDGRSECAAIWASRPYSTTEALESGAEPECQNGMFPFWTGYYTDGASFWSAGEYGHSGLSIDTAMATITRQSVYDLLGGGIDLANALADAVTPIMVDVATSLATGKLVAELPELPA